MILQLAFVLTAIIIGARLGGIGLGVMGGVGLGILTFVFGLQPTAPPIDVMLMIAAVTRHTAQSAGNLPVHLHSRNRTCSLLRIACHCRGSHRN